MDFPAALNFLIYHNAPMHRAGWNGKGQWVKAQFPDTKSMMDEPYLYLHNAQGKKVPWIPSQGDIFAMDWEPGHGVA